MDKCVLLGSITIVESIYMSVSGGRYFTKISILSILAIRMLVSILSSDIDNFDIGLSGFDHYSRILTSEDKPQIH